MHSSVTSKNAQWRRLIWPTLYIHILLRDKVIPLHNLLQHRACNASWSLDAILRPCFCRSFHVCFWVNATLTNVAVVP